MDQPRWGGTEDIEDGMGNFPVRSDNTIHDTCPPNTNMEFICTENDTLPFCGHDVSICCGCFWTASCRDGTWMGVDTANV